MRILIADDSDLARAGLKVLLGTRLDCEICAEASNGMQAISRAIEFNPDLIILDYSMPGMDGLLAAQEIYKAVPSAQILMCTLFPSAALEVEAMKYGVGHVISKAEMSVSLLSAIEEIAIRQRESTSLPPRFETI
jgi:DNA-binding NarL/FixJ family response regulator